MKPYCSNAASGWRPARLLGKFLCGGAVAILGTAIAWAQPDYAPAHWTPPSCTKWYTSGYARQFCVIHDIEGYYLSAVSYLNSCATGTSGNYVYQPHCGRLPVPLLPGAIRAIAGARRQRT